MAKTPRDLRKQRTRQHIIADLSVHHVEGVILNAGHSVQRIERDYGYDLFMSTFDEQGYAESGIVWLQLKAAETLHAVGADYVFDLDIRDYNLWVQEQIPVVFILFDATRRRAFWLPIQRYFREDDNRRPKKGAKTVRIRIPARQTVNQRAISAMRKLKRDTHLTLIGGNRETN